MDRCPRPGIAGRAGPPKQVPADPKVPPFEDRMRPPVASNLHRLHEEEPCRQRLRGVRVPGGNLRGTEWAAAGFARRGPPEALIPDTNPERESLNGALERACRAMGHRAELSRYSGPAEGGGRRNCGPDRRGPNGI